MGNLARPLPYSIIFKLRVMKQEVNGFENNFRKFRPSVDYATSTEKQQLYGQIVEECLSKEDQRIVIWLHLKVLLSQDNEGINWIMEAVGQMIDEVEATLLSSYQ